MAIYANRILFRHEFIVAMDSVPIHAKILGGHAVIAQTDIFTCAFCGKSQWEVAVLVTGPHVCICDECITICNELLNATVGERTGERTGDRPPNLYL